MQLVVVAAVMIYTGTPSLQVTLQLKNFTSELLQLFCT